MLPARTTLRRTMTALAVVGGVLWTVAGASACSAPERAQPVVSSTADCCRLGCQCCEAPAAAASLGRPAPASRAELIGPATVQLARSSAAMGCVCRAADPAAPGPRPARLVSGSTPDGSFAPGAFVWATALPPPGCGVDWPDAGPPNLPVYLRTAHLLI